MPTGPPGPIPRQAKRLGPPANAVEVLRRARCTQEHIAQELGLSRATVSRILKRRGLRRCCPPSSPTSHARAMSAKRGDHPYGHQEARSLQSCRPSHWAIAGARATSAITAPRPVGSMSTSPSAEAEFPHRLCRHVVLREKGKRRAQDLEAAVTLRWHPRRYHHPRWRGMGHGGPVGKAFGNALRAKAHHQAYPHQTRRYTPEPSSRPNASSMTMLRDHGPLDRIRQLRPAKSRSAEMSAFGTTGIDPTDSLAIDKQQSARLGPEPDNLS